MAVEAAEKEPPSYAPERQRFYILAVLSLFSFCQCLNWFTFSSVDPQKVEDYYGAAVGGQAAIDMLLNWGPVAGIAFFPVQLWLLEQRDGLRRNVVAGALLVLAGAALRLVPTLALAPAARARWASGLWLQRGPAAQRGRRPVLYGACLARRGRLVPRARARARDRVRRDRQRARRDRRLPARPVARADGRAARAAALGRARARGRARGLRAAALPGRARRAAERRGRGRARRRRRHRARARRDAPRAARGRAERRLRAAHARRRRARGRERRLAGHAPGDPRARGLLGPGRRRLRLPQLGRAQRRRAREREPRRPLLPAAPQAADRGRDGRARARRGVVELGLLLRVAPGRARRRRRRRGRAGAARSAARSS